MFYEENMAFNAVAAKDNVAYASDYKRNGLFKIDLLSGVCDYIGLFEDEPLTVKGLHTEAVWEGDKIYFIPASGNRIDIFCTQNYTMKSIDIPKPDAKKFFFYMKNYKFIGAVRNREVLWILPATYPGMLKLNLRTDEIEVYDGWLEDDEYFFRRGFCQEDDKIIMANGKNNAVLIFDMQKEKGKIKHIGAGNHGVMKICKEGTKYWFAPRLPGTVVCWDSVTDEVSEIEKYPEEFEAGNIVFSDIYCFEGKIYFLPGRSSHALVLESETLEIDKKGICKLYKESILEPLFETETDRYYREREAGGRQRFLKLRINDNVVSDFCFCFKDDGSRDRRMIELKTNEQKQLFVENSNVGLKDFVKGLT